ncbi:MAG: hypothetical protein ACRDKS_02080 [Actinomycetota bacterium]
MTDDPTTPQEIWALIERADERVKYASNRDERAAYQQARELLERAIAAAGTVAGASKLEEQARIRLDDLSKLESA